MLPNESATHKHMNKATVTRVQLSDTIISCYHCYQCTHGDITERTGLLSIKFIVIIIINLMVFTWELS